MNVAVFSVTMPRSSEEYHHGEMTMFTLPDYERFAGVIYLPDTITFPSRDKDVTEPLVRIAREKGLPVVTIDYKIEGLPCYFCDDSEVVKAMVRHLINKHGCRDIAYMTGTKGHPTLSTALRLLLLPWLKTISQWRTTAHITATSGTTRAKTS